MKMYFLPTQKKDYLFFCIALVLLTFLTTLPTSSYASATSTASFEKQYDISSLMDGWEQINPADTPQSELVPELKDASLTTKTITIKKGNTLYGVLKKAGVPLKQQRKIVAIISKQKIFRFDIGKVLTLAFRTSPKTKRKELIALTAQLGKNSKYAIRLQANGTFTAAVEKTKYKGKLQYVGGIIKESFLKDVQYFGLPSTLAARAFKLLTERQKLTKKNLKNTDFEIIYEVYPKSSGIAPRIQYIRLGGVYSLQLFYFTGKSGASYYDIDGNTLVTRGKIELVKNARISSKFGYRIHPILKRRLLHTGMDYAAPRGTPIHAAADGVVEFVGRNGGYGKHIRLRHSKTMKTSYSHMHKFKKGLKRGSRVKAGDIIGYVGSTGRSTGPHLHFEVRKNGRAIDPLKAELPRPSKLEGVELAQFKLSQVKLFLQVAQQRVMKNALAALTPEALVNAAL